MMAREIHLDSCYLLSAGTKPCHLVLFGTIWRYKVLLGAIKRYLALELIIFIFTNN